MHEQSSTSLPSSDELLDYIQSLEECDPDMQITPFAEGAHTRVFRGDSREFGRIVVRCAKDPAHNTGLDSEAHALALLGNQAPRTFKHGRLPSGESVLLQEYIAGEPRTFSELNATEISSLASVISEVHAITSTHFSGRAGETPDCCEGTYEDYLWAMMYESVNVRLSRLNVEPYGDALKLLEKGQKRLRGIVGEQAEHFRQPNQPFSLQHHDCNENNVLWSQDGAVKLIDWNPTFGDPADELAYIFTDNHCSQAFIETFLQNYQAPEHSGDVAARIPAYVLKNLLDDLAWAIEMHELHPEEEKWDTIYQQRLANLSSYLRERNE